MRAKRPAEAETWGRRARTVIETVPRGAGLRDRRGPLLEELVEAFASQGLYVEAERIVRGLRSREERAEGLRRLVDSMLRRGDPGRAVAAARRALVAAEGLPDAQKEIVWTFIRAERLDEARVVAEHIRDATARARPLAHVAGALARAGRRPAAFAVLDRIPDVGLVDSTLAGMVTELGRAGQAHDAELAARRIRNPAAQLNSLASLAFLLVAPRDMIGLPHQR